MSIFALPTEPASGPRGSMSRAVHKRDKGEEQNESKEISATCRAQPTAGISLAATGLSLAGSGHKESCSVTYTITEFTCVTCATGLEVTLLRHKGVTRANASYPEGTVVVGFDDSAISENALKAIITNCGFSVA